MKQAILFPKFSDKMPMLSKLYLNLKTLTLTIGIMYGQVGYTQEEIKNNASPDILSGNAIASGSVGQIAYHNNLSNLVIQSVDQVNYFTRVYAQQSKEYPLLKSFFEAANQRLAIARSLSLKVKIDLNVLDKMMASYNDQLKEYALLTDAKVYPLLSSYEQMGRLHDLRLVIRNDFKKDEKTRTSFGQFIQTNAKKIKTRINIPLSLDGLEHSSFLSYFSNIEGKNPNYKLWHNYLKEIDNLFNTHYADSRALRNYILDYDNKVQLERLVILKKELKPEISPLAEKFIIYVGDQSQVAKAQVIIEEARGHGKSHKITIPAHNPAASHSR